MLRYFFQYKSIVSIHAPAWGATFPWRPSKVAFFVSIHAPAWGATSKQKKEHPRKKFQSTLPHGERLISGRTTKLSPEFQSTLPHGERHGKAQRDSQQKRVSIHAPAWGATWQLNSISLTIEVSIHAPAWGATISPKYIPKVYRRFNPRSRMGSDCQLGGNRLPWRCFNPRSRMGSDRERCCFVKRYSWFQSTLPHGERRVSASNQNSYKLVSIHAPAWGATKWQQQMTE